MIEKIKNGLKKRQVKVFLLFLLCSVFAWFISKLSESYTDRTDIRLTYINSPDNQMLIHASHDKINVKIEGIGFQFLRYSINRKTVEINLSTIKKRGGDFFLLQNEYKTQIESQLNTSMKLLEITNDTLFFDFQEVLTKKVPIKPSVELNFAQNHLLDGTLVLEPDSITIKGPKSEVDTILNVKSSNVNLNELTSDFSKKINLIKPEALLNTHFSDEFVIIKGKVSKFSEKSIKVKITPIYLPENTSLKMFPAAVMVLCKGSLETLKTLSTADFEVVVDYRKANNSISNKLSLVIQKQPTNLQSAVLRTTEIEYILEHK